MKVLICDDDKMTMRILEFQFKREGFEIIKAVDGREARNILNENDDIDLLIADFYMPYVNGMELITHVRETLQRNTPIIIISVAKVEDKIQQAFELGANAFVAKPFEAEELMNEINKVMDKIDFGIWLKKKFSNTPAS